MRFNKLRWNTISTRLFVWFLLSVLLLLSLLSGIFYQYSTEQMNHRFGEIARKNVSQALDNFGLLAEGYNSLSKTISTNSDVQRILTDHDVTPSLALINERTIINLLEAVFYSRNDLMAIHVISSTGKVYSHEASVHPYAPHFMQSSWYADILRSQGEMVWFGTHTTTLTVQDQPVVSFGRVIYDLYSREPIGVLLIEANPLPILTTLANLQVGPDSQAYIAAFPRGTGRQDASEAYELLAESGTDAGSGLTPWSAIEPMLGVKDKARIVTRDEHGDLVVIGNQPVLNWSVVSITPKSNFQVQLEQANRFFIMVLGLSVLAAIALATVMSRSISAPMIRLVREMKAIERGNLNLMEEVRSFEEMNYLMHNYNVMILRIRELIDRVRTVTSSEKNAQLYALQSQVNPHFLYNTLDLIYWELEEMKNERLENIILSLSRMFRYSSEWEQTDVTLEEELKQMHHYLVIIQARAEHHLDIRNEIPETWHQVRIPKMTLQPLIENAVVHGLSQKNQQGLIHLRLAAAKDCLQIQIHDNGGGIQPAKLLELQRMLDKVVQLEGILYEEEEKPIRRLEEMPIGTEGAGIGLINVHRRLVLKFGAQYGLRIDSEDGGGTTVLISLPKPTDACHFEYHIAGGAEDEYSRCGR
ncbi:cache domain-containing sensor histidine kinase [Paenibacillus rigui]|uniref:histidine kinase n=1 Tax=Paenibacillus rigui TaxID=554312 RepID=A0A229URP7_9BACL|nr:sensor histidine kinase [Paenibacillus rigui]OXM85579.1 two-component sensor histidine kinase [Paenibacillus rigui]